MEFHSVHKPFHHSNLGDKRHQMVNLNCRLETYLGRVKLLEEENALLAKEVQTHRALTRRNGLEEELQQARLEVDAAWRDRVFTELEISRLAEQLQALDLQRQKEAQAQVEAKMKLEQSRKELEEEQRAQIWLREKINQLELEMRYLIKTHKEDMAPWEATLNQSRATVPPIQAQRGNQMPNLLQLGQEYSQRAAEVWQEAAEAHQGQLAWLENSLNQARKHLTQVGQEVSESQLKIQVLKKEIASAHDVRLHLKKTVAQQEARYQQLQDHLEGLEAEKEELLKQIGHVLHQKRGLLQVKISLGLEVATYRAVLDSESLGGDISLLRNRSTTDTVFSPLGVRKNYLTQLCASQETSCWSSIRGITGTPPAMITATPSWSRKPVILIGTPNMSMKPAYDDTTKSATWKNPFPKLLQNGAAENVKPEEVHEKVTHAEPLSPPNEQEALAETTLGDKEGEGEQYWNSEERPVVESVVSYQIESGLSADLPFNDEVSQHPFTTTNLTPYHVRMTEEPYGSSDESDKDVHVEKDLQVPHAPIDAWEEKRCIGKEAEHKQVETSDSETEAALKPNFKSKTSTPVSEDDLGESVFKKVTGFRQDENILKEDAVEMRQEISCSIEGTYEMDIEDKLYPDGEEMDSWNSVTEKRTDLKTNHGIKKNEEKQQHAEPASMRENEKEIRQDFATVEKDNNLASMSDTSDDDGQHAALDQEHALLPENAEKDNEEDPQNVSLSWRTEPESNSYAQDNTLADTCPLIRYKSDETDSNTQVSHMGESSEDEQEKRIIETGTGMWSEDKSKRFGTMEDLCEEVEGEGLGEEYDLVYTHIEDRGVRHAITVSVHATLGNDTENAEETISKVSEEHSEELSKSMVPTNVDYTEELKADRLVEQKLENLATDSYSAHFAQQQVSESDNILHLQDMSFEEMTEQDEVGKTKTEDMSSCADPEVIANHQYVSSTTVIYKLYEHPYSSDFSLVKPQKESGANEVVQPEDPPEIREKDDEHNVSMVTHADVTEDHSGFSDFISRPDLEETNNKEDPTSVLQVTADQENLQGVAAPAQVIEVVHVEPSCVSQKHLIKDVTHCQKFPEIPETVLEKPSEETDIKHLNNDCEEFESTENDVKGSDEAIMTHKKEPDSVPDENNACVVKDSTKLLNTNDNGQMTTDNGLHGSFSSGVKNDFCMSSLESGATYQPDEAVEQTNKNLEFPDNLFWGNSENTNVSSKALAAKKEKEQMHLEVKQMICRNTAEGELVHSEESEAEGKSSSSGEEIVLVL